MSLDSRREGSNPFDVIAAKNVRGRIHMKNLIQPAVYRAPEGFLHLRVDRKSVV